VACADGHGRPGGAGFAVPPGVARACHALLAPAPAIGVQPRQAGGPAQDLPATPRHAPPGQRGRALTWAPRRLRRHTRSVPGHSRACAWRRNVQRLAGGRPRGGGARAQAPGRRVAAARAARDVPSWLLSGLGGFRGS